MMAPLVRILLRWIGGIALARGWMSDASVFQDPDVVTIGCYVLAAVCGVVSEGWYFVARKRGWSR